MVSPRSDWCEGTSWEVFIVFCFVPSGSFSPTSQVINLNISELYNSLPSLEDKAFLTFFSSFAFSWEQWTFLGFFVSSLAREQGNASQKLFHYGPCLQNLYRCLALLNKLSFRLPASLNSGHHHFLGSIMIFELSYKLIWRYTTVKAWKTGNRVNVPLNM